MDVKENYSRWLSSPRVSEKEKEVLISLSEEERNDAFYKDCEFGTAGMRGVMGPGTNRMNSHTVGRATVAFGEFILKGGKEAASRGVVISHDNRYNSREFTLLTSSLLNQMGINTYIFDSLRPTPELSFAVRYLHAAGGVMITASHNPKQYNGYKVYDDSGCQLVPSKIKPMLEILSKLPDELSYVVPTARKRGEQVMLAKDIDDEYIKLVKGCQEHPELDKSHFTLIYSPQHGASYEVSMRVFKECGYNVVPVAEQCTHDPSFSGTASPNPELEAAWTKSLEYAKQYHADLAVMTDPDGDRCGLAYLSSDGTYKRLTGNQSGALLIDYLLSCKKQKGTLPKDAVIYDTIVTSSFGREVAASYGVKCESFLTGFKFIGERIRHYEEFGKGPTFVFGYEESYGCLIAPFVRDKDGTQAILLYTEMALYYKSKGLHLDEAYAALEKRIGYHFTVTKDCYFEGMEGNATMKKLMAELHDKPLEELSGRKVAYVEDYLSAKRTYADGKVEEIKGLPASDVIKYCFDDESTLAIRPSGTEPKIKFYIETISRDSILGLEKKADDLNSAIRSYLGLKA